MKFSWHGALLLLVSSSSYCMASTPHVVTDIPTTHSLVSLILGDLGEAAVLIQGNESPHGFSLRPTQARQLQQADIVFWTGRELTPWLVKATGSLSNSAESIELMRQEGTLRLPLRNAEDSLHSHGHDGTGDEHITTDTDAADAHSWLDPVNALHWLKVITREISALDESNRDIYQANYLQAKAQLETLIDKITDQLSDFHDDPFVVFHDSYHYFENRFALRSPTAISISDAEHPNIRRLSRVQAQIRSLGKVCVFAEPQFSDKLVRSATRGLDVAYGSLDPLGSTQTKGPALYGQTLTALASELERCLTTTR